MPVTGNDLINWGFKPGKNFPDMLKRANSLQASGLADSQIRNSIKHMEDIQAPTVGLRSSDIAEGKVAEFFSLDEDPENKQSVIDSMNQIMRTPVANKATLMPDACPTGPLGSMPVGGVVQSSRIHPGWHSSDVCCSVMMSVFPAGIEPSRVLDAVHASTHFGPGTRENHDALTKNEAHPGEFASSSRILQDRFKQNRFLRDIAGISEGYLGTQGDGNHFAFVGTSEKSGNTCLVTHHGSRAPGAKLFAKGMKLAKHQTSLVAPDVDPRNAWIVDQDDEKDYWSALSLIQLWTRYNHMVIHKATAANIGCRGFLCGWNAHNFVFKHPNTPGYLHGKGATSMEGLGMKFIPLSMGEPILVAMKHKDAPKSAMGFAPHGAGRTMSRTKYLASLEGTPEEQFAKETEGLDIRSWSENPDASELPSSYKNARHIQEVIENQDLAEIKDRILPYGSIMAGVSDQDKARNEGGLARREGVSLEQCPYDRSDLAKRWADAWNRADRKLMNEATE